MDGLRDEEKKQAEVCISMMISWFFIDKLDVLVLHELLD